ncbi:sugar ABC transporter ATP-binding protein [Microbacterium murale]|uniref:Ribose ABC transporter ATP-binding protein n=1 Tax=Microbacterium murale TaxID=1081040 RepID=A0ABQ1RH51_9MICO|nr:sugar ABC transporter ATP-binding protein [Microbacterium murale]GGD70126.1 ribose ABC transporter ATP-binding protein [Microbacterium murale]
MQSQNPAAETLAISMRGVRKSFGKFEVLRGADFEVRRGEVHALLGGNGAGKSTLMKILQGVHRPDSGEVVIEGKRVDFSSPHDAAAAGVGMVFQEFSLIPSLTVARNIFLGREPRRFGVIDDRAMVRRAQEIFDRMGTDLDPRVVLSDLPVGYWQLTEIAKALSVDARILIMDEPTASLPYTEVEQLFQLIERLKEQSISVVYISHRMAEIERVADRLTVIRDGRTVLTGKVSEVPPEKVVETIVGREILQGLSRDTSKVIAGEPVLSVRSLSSGDRVQDVTFDVARGEVLGLAGLIGSGRTEIAQSLFGIDRIAAGEVLVDGRRVHIRRPQDAIDAGIMLVPEDRAQQGLVLSHSVRSNLLLPSLGRLRLGPLINDLLGRDLCKRLMTRLQIRSSAIEETVSRLSGGNQQKVVISKWLGLQQSGNPTRVLILDEPTKGVDIGTKTEIMQLVLDMADEGIAVIFISSELQELLSVSDRVLVLRDGRIEEELLRSQIPDEEALQLAVQGVH